MPIHRVTIVGLGALGSHLVLLARNWDAVLRVIDFDRVESKNTQSQFHVKQSMGKNKAVALKTAMQGLYGMKLEAHSVRVGSSNREFMLQDADLVIDCTDNYEARDLIQMHCVNNDVPCLHGCLSADGTFARIVWTEDFIADAEGEEGEATCEDGQNLPFYVLAAATIAQIVQKFLETGKRESWQLTPFSFVRLA